MPIESQFDALPVPDPSDNSASGEFLVTARRTLHSTVAKVKHCLHQLSDEDLRWRGFSEHNSVHNLILHVCGNLRQWIVSGVGGAQDVRQRADEFHDRNWKTSDELVQFLESCVGEVDGVLERCDPQRLTNRVQIQGFDLSVMAAIWESLNHLVGHMHQIVFVTRLRLGTDYRFHWSPATS